MPRLVLALFENEAAADAAVKAMKEWDKANQDVELGAVGVMVKDEKGKLKTHKMGSRHTATGALIFGLGALLTVGTVVGLGVIGGAVLGGGFGALFHKGLKMSKDDVERLNAELDGGKAAVGIMAEGYAADLVAAKLVELGGKSEAYEVSPEAVAHAQETVTAESEAPAEDAPEEPSGA
jgi:hypothetical protein